MMKESLIRPYKRKNFRHHAVRCKQANVESFIWRKVQNFVFCFFSRKEKSWNFPLICITQIQNIEKNHCWTANDRHYYRSRWLCFYSLSGNKQTFVKARKRNILLLLKGVNDEQLYWTNAQLRTALELKKLLYKCTELIPWSHSWSCGLLHSYDDGKLIVF